MVLLRIVCIATVLSGISVFGMEKLTLDSATHICGMLAYGFVVKKYSMPDRALAEIKLKAKDSKDLAAILNDKDSTSILLGYVGENCKGFWRENAGFGCSDRQGFYKERAAAFLGTQGAIACGKEYIKDNKEAQKNLCQYLINIVQYGHEPNERNDGYTFKNEGLDIISAALEMGLDPNSIEGYSFFGETRPILVAAARNNKSKTIDFLMQQGANVNAINLCGQTPLIAATENGCVEMVQKLLDAKALVWLLDAYDKTALDYAKEYLDAYQNDEDKEPYKIIVKLLEDAQKKLPVLIKQ